MPLEIKSRRSTYHSSKSIRSERTMGKKIFRIFMIIVIVLLLLFGAGAGYTWFMGRFQAPVMKEEPVQIVKKIPDPPKQIDDTAKVGVSSQSFTDKVTLGKNASLFIKTNPMAACSIRVEYNKEASTDSGLVPKKADEYGVASWAWTVEESRPLGKWPVTVTCANAKNSGVLTLDLYVIKPE